MKAEQHVARSRDAARGLEETGGTRRRAEAVFARWPVESFGEEKERSDASQKAPAVSAVLPFRAWPRRALYVREY